jgi:hypothetical protein
LNWSNLNVIIMKNTVNVEIRMVKLFYQKKFIEKIFLKAIKPENSFCWKVRNYVCYAETRNSKIH